MPTLPEASRRRSALWIGLVGFALFALVMAGLSFWTLSRWSTLARAPAAEAERAFALRRTALGDGPAYLEITEAGGVLVRRELEGAAPEELEALHVLAWEPAGERLLGVAFPFWFVRLKTTDSLNLGTLLAVLSRDWGHLDLKVTEEDLQRRGRGLLLDHRLADGKRILLWTE